MNAWFVKHYRDILFFVSACFFALCVYLVFGCLRLHTNYYRYANRGVWEDIMVKRAFGEDFESVEQADSSRYTKVLQRNPTSIDGVLQMVEESVGGSHPQIVVSKLATADINIAQVMLAGKDISRIHGQFDVWLKSCRPRADLSPQLMPPPRGTIILTRHLAYKLAPQVVEHPQAVVLNIGRWGPNNPLYRFSVHHVLDMGTGSNAVIIHPDDLYKFGYTKGYNCIGVNIGSGNPEKIQHKIKNRLDPAQFIVQTALNQKEKSSTLVLLTAPNAIMGLFAIIMLINFLFVVFYNYQRRRSELDLMLLYNYGIFRATRSFTFVNVLPGILGFLAALMMLVLDWPLSLNNITAQMNRGLPIALESTDIFLFNPIPSLILGSCLLCFVLINCWYLHRKFLTGEMKRLVRQEPA